MLTFYQYLHESKRNKEEDISLMNQACDNIYSNIKTVIKTDPLLKGTTTNWEASGKRGSEVDKTTDAKRFLILTNKWTVSRKAILKHLSDLGFGVYSSSKAKSGEGMLVVSHRDSSGNVVSKIGIACKDKGGKSNTTKDTQIKEEISVYVFMHGMGDEDRVGDYITEILDQSGIDGVKTSSKLDQYVLSSVRQYNVLTKKLKRDKSASEIEDVVGANTFDPTQYVWLRGDAEAKNSTSVLGLMYSIVRKCGIQRNTWNPADVWGFLDRGTNIKTIEKKLKDLKSIKDDPSGDLVLGQLNSLVEAGINTLSIVPISLKNTTKASLSSCKVYHVKDSEKIEDFAEVLEEEDGWEFNSIEISDTFRNVFITCNSGFSIRMSARSSADSTNLSIEGANKNYDFRMGAIEKKVINERWINSLIDSDPTEKELMNSSAFRKNISKIVKWANKTNPGSMKDVDVYMSNFEACKHDYETDPDNINRSRLVLAHKISGTIANFVDYWDKSDDGFENFFKNIFLIVHRLSFKGPSSYILAIG